MRKESEEIMQIITLFSKLERQIAVAALNSEWNRHV